MDNNGIKHQLHNLDDFHLLGAPQATSVVQVCKRPCSVRKPWRAKSLLRGIQNRFGGHAAQPKCRERGLVLSWRSKQAETKHELQVLIGHLSHAAKLVQHGRIFMQRIFNLVKRVYQAYHHDRFSLKQIYSGGQPSSRTGMAGQFYGKRPYNTQSHRTLLGHGGLGLSALVRHGFNYNGHSHREKNSLLLRNSFW